VPQGQFGFATSSAEQQSSIGRPRSMLRARSSPVQWARGWHRANPSSS
jgi:hypothetical protein